MKTNKSIFGLVNIHVRSSQALAAIAAMLERKIGCAEESATLLNVCVVADKTRPGFNVTALTLIRDGENLPGEKVAVVHRIVNSPVKTLLFDSPANATVECVEFALTLIDAIRLDMKQLQRPGSAGLKIFEQASNDFFKSRDARRRKTVAYAGGKNASR